MRSLTKMKAHIVVIFWDPDAAYQGRLCINLMKHFASIYVAQGKPNVPDDEQIKRAAAVLHAHVDSLTIERFQRLNKDAYFAPVWNGFNLVELMMGLRITLGEKLSEH